MNLSPTTEGDDDGYDCSRFCPLPLSPQKGEDRRRREEAIWADAPFPLTLSFLQQKFDTHHIPSFSPRPKSHFLVNDSMDGTKTFTRFFCWKYCLQDRKSAGLYFLRSEGKGHVIYIFFLSRGREDNLLFQPSTVKPTSAHPFLPSPFSQKAISKMDGRRRKIPPFSQRLEMCHYTAEAQPHGGEILTRIHHLLLSGDLAFFKRPCRFQIKRKATTHFLLSDNMSSNFSLLSTIAPFFFSSPVDFKTFFPFGKERWARSVWHIADTRR